MKKFFINSRFFINSGLVRLRLAMTKKSTKAIERHNRYSGFALLEVMLAVIVIGLSLGGGYYMYQSVLTSQKNSKTANEIMSMSSIFSDLFAAHLTTTITSPSALITAFYSSGRIPENFFSNTTSSSTITMLSPYGALKFSLPTGGLAGSSFSVTVPVSENSDDARNQICDSIKNYVQSCIAGAGASVVVTVTTS